MHDDRLSKEPLLSELGGGGRGGRLAGLVSMMLHQETSLALHIPESNFK